MNLANKMCEKKTAFKTQVSIWIIELRPIEAIALLINAAISSLFLVVSLQTKVVVLSMISNLTFFDLVCKSPSSEMVFCYQNCSDLLSEMYI